MEDFYPDIFRFGLIMNDFENDAGDKLGATGDQCFHGAWFAIGYPGHQGFVGLLCV
jgi:hypothetical protein